MIQVDLTHMRRFIALPYEAALAPRLRIAHNHLQKNDGAGGDFTGWVRLPQEYDRQEFDRIQAAARRIQSDSRALVVIGIGGSYLGARGVIECLCSPNYNLRRGDGDPHHDRRPRFLRERHLQVRHHHGACRGLPVLPGAAGEEIRPRRRGPAHLRHHRPAEGGPEVPGRSGRV